MTAEAVAVRDRAPRPVDRPLAGTRLVVAGWHTLLLEALIGYLERKGAEVVAAGPPGDLHRLAFDHRPEACVVEDPMEDTSVTRVVLRTHRALPETKLLVLAHRHTAAAERAVQRGLLQALVPRSGGLPLLLQALVDLTTGSAGDTSTPQVALATGGVALTPRESEVLRLLGAGATNAQIGQALGISVNTVRTHVHNLLQKLGVRERSAAALRVVEASAGPVRIPLR